MSDAIYAGLTKTRCLLDETFFRSGRHPATKWNDTARHAPLVFHVACAPSVWIHSSWGPLKTKNTAHMKYSTSVYKPNLAWLGRIKPEISMKFLLSMYVLPGEQKQRAPSLLNTHAQAHAHTHLHTPLPLERVSRHVLHVIVGEMEWKTGLGLWVQVAGFRVTRSRSQRRLVLPWCFLPHRLGAGDGDGGGGWMEHERGRWEAI